MGFGTGTSNNIDDKGKIFLLRDALNLYFPLPLHVSWQVPNGG
jgi:hypothetical protein